MILPLILAGSQSAAAGETNHPRGARAPLTNFDYLVLASLADSARPISLVAYRPSEVAVELREH
jgi:hypothetical protein